jgi:hypothetical protein
VPGPSHPAGQQPVQRRQQHLLARAACSISAWLVLLMSSLVQAKCTNSAAALQFGVALDAALDPHLHRLDVVVGGLFDVLDGLRIGSEKALDQASAAGRARLVDSGANSAKPASDSAMNHSTSTCTRRCIRPCSDSSGRSACTRAA